MMPSPHLTRRRLLTGGIALGALGLLAACGADATATVAPTTAASTAPSTAPSAAPSVAPSAAPAASASSAASAAPSAVASAAGTPAGAATPSAAATRPVGVASPTVASGRRTITTFRGPVEVPANPQRIVSIDFYSPLTLLDLGVTPLGVINYAQTSLNLIKPDYRPILSSLPKVGTNAETDVEAVAVLKPDLIIGWSNNVKTYDQLRAIAPTVIFEYSVTSWGTFAQQVAEAAGVTPAFDALVKRYQDRAAGIKQTHAATLGRVKWAVISSGGSTDWILPNPNSTNGLGAIALAGAQFIASQAAITTPQNVSFEQINLLAEADVILFPSSPEGAPAASTVALLDNPLFKALKAAQAGHLYPLSYFNSGNYSGALGALDAFEAALKKL